MCICAWRGRPLPMGPGRNPEAVWGVLAVGRATPVGFSLAAIVAEENPSRVLTNREGPVSIVVETKRSLTDRRRTGDNVRM